MNGMLRIKNYLFFDSRGQRVPSQNLNPDLLMMEPTEDWYRCDAPDLLRPAKIRSIFVQGEMRPAWL